MLHRFNFLLIVFLTTGCLTPDSGMPTARTVAPDESVTTVGLHYAVKHRNDVLQRRFKGDASDDFNHSDPHLGVNVARYWGLTERSDAGVNFSLGFSSVEWRYGLFNAGGYATSLGTRLGLPTFAWDYYHAYQAGLGWYHSYEVTDQVSLYAVPMYARALSAHDAIAYSGVSAGLLFGNASGFFAEYTYLREQRRHRARSAERYKLGYIDGLDRLNHRTGVKASEGPIAIKPQIGAWAGPAQLSLGLAIAPQAEGWQRLHFTMDLGIGELPRLHETRAGYSTLRYFSLRYEDPTPIFGVLTYGAGLARRELRANIERYKGWYHMSALSHGIDLHVAQTFDHYRVEWLGVYIPLAFLPHSQHQHAPYGLRHKPSNEVDALATAFESRPNLSFCKIRALL